MKVKRSFGFLSLVCVLSLTFVIGCQQQVEPPAPSTQAAIAQEQETPPVDTETAHDDPPNPCSAGAPPANPAQPVVCVDDSNLPTITPSPDPVKAHKSVVLRWYLKSGSGNLAILFDEADAVGNITCTPGTGICRATTSPAAKVNHDYKYTIVVNKNNTTYDPLDPIVVIEDP